MREQIRQLLLASRVTEARAAGQQFGLAPHDLGASVVRLARVAAALHLAAADEVPQAIESIERADLAVEGLP